ncbi:MAG TPA: hypothetical protein VGF64_10475 [Acidimicrobiales bacterium]
MTITDQPGRPAAGSTDAAADRTAQEMLARAADTGVSTVPESENMTEMIQWVVGRLRWERQLESLRGSRSATTEEADGEVSNG